jgi:hypothetical protein
MEEAKSFKAIPSLYMIETIIGTRMSRLSNTITMEMKWRIIT